MAIQFVRDPWGVARNTYPDKRIEEWDRRTNMIKNLLNNRISFKFITPVIRKLLHIDYKEQMSGIVIYFGKEFPVKIRVTHCIATDYITTFFVSEIAMGNRKYFLSLHDESDPSYLSRLSWLAEEAYKLPLQPIVINEAMMEKLRDSDPILFHGGIRDFFIRQQLNLLKTVKQVLMPLRIGKIKGASYAIQAAELTHSAYPDIMIKAFGDFPRDSVPEFIRYHFHPNDDEIIQLYRESSIFVLPSLLEGMALPPLEAMACSCAVVSTDCIGIRVYMRDEENGLIVNKADPNALFQAVSRLIEDDTLRQSLAKNGWETSRRYTYENMTKEFISIMDSA